MQGNELGKASQGNQTQTERAEKHNTLVITNQSGLRIQTPLHHTTPHHTTPSNIIIIHSCMYVCMYVHKDDEALRKLHDQQF